MRWTGLQSSGLKLPQDSVHQKLLNRWMLTELLKKGTFLDTVYILHRMHNAIKTHHAIVTIKKAQRRIST